MRLDELRSIERVQVFKNNLFAGILSRTPQGARFQYDESARLKLADEHGCGLAFTLPVSKSAYEITGTNLHPFFAGLLPEGLRLKALRQSLKSSEDDLFSMLLALGADCIGDVYVQAETEARQNFEFEVLALEAVSFFDLFERSITDPDLRMRDLDSGVPGIIPKISASMVSFPLRIKKRNRAYLLKLEPEEHPLLIRNENFFMQMATACGFYAAPTTVVSDKNGVPGLLIERFDRFYDKSSKLFRKLHQEDACQILGRYPQDKYRLSLREIAEGVREFATSPIIEIKRLIELYVFSYLIGNGDLHAKNISLLEGEDGRTRLSPVYDMLSTLPYGDRKMALHLGAKDDNFSAKDFIEFGKLFDFPSRAIEAMLTRLLKNSENWGPRFKEIGFPEKLTRDLERTFTQRAKKLSE